MAKKSRERRMKQLAQRRAAERRHQRRRRILAGVVAAAVAASGIGFGVFALLSGGEEPRAVPTPGPTATATKEAEMTGEVACGAEVPKASEERKKTYDGPPEMQLDGGTDYRAVMQTSCGEIVIDLHESQTPVTVNSFVFLAREGFYDGLVFHRVIPDFMNQGGDPEGTGTGGPGYQFEDEFVDELTFDRPGLLAMANSGPSTNGSQFFITAVPTPHLDGLHTIFGEVVEGIEVVTQINTLPTDGSDRPSQTVYIESVKIREG
jgi:cyclophilin family peptidyl-prolyl cis-trans isomerase